MNEDLDALGKFGGLGVGGVELVWLPLIVGGNRTWCAGLTTGGIAEG